MSKLRLRNMEVEAIRAEAAREIEQIKNIAEQRLMELGIINENLLSLVVTVLNKFGTVDPEKYDGAPYLLVSKAALQAVDTGINGVETKYTEDPENDEVFVVLGRNGPKVVAAQQPSAEPASIRCSCSGTIVEFPISEDDGKHVEHCVYWKDKTVAPIQGGAVATVFRCARHNRVGPLGAFCPVCNEERVQRIVCRNVLSYRRDDGTVVQTVEEAKAGDSGYHMLQCGHTVVQHMRGTGMCKIGSCECPEFLCAHNERQASEDGGIMCMNPSCDWRMSKEDLLDMAKRSQPQTQQATVEELDAMQTETKETIQ